MIVSCVAVQVNVAWPDAFACTVTYKAAPFHIRFLHSKRLGFRGIFDNTSVNCFKSIFPKKVRQSSSYLICMHLQE